MWMAGFFPNPFTMPAFTASEVGKHTAPNDCWMIVHGKVYNVTEFLSSHPGGEEILLEQGGFIK